MGAIIYHKGGIKFIARSNEQLRVDIFGLKSGSPLVDELKDALDGVCTRTIPRRYEADSVDTTVGKLNRLVTQEKSHVALFEMTALLSEEYMRATMSTRGVFAFIRRKALSLFLERYEVDNDQANAKKCVDEIGSILYNTLGIQKVNLVYSSWGARVFGGFGMAVQTPLMAWSSVLTAIDSVRSLHERGEFVAVGEMVGAIVMGGGALLVGWFAHHVTFGVTHKTKAVGQPDVTPVQSQSV